MGFELNSIQPNRTSLAYGTKSTNESRTCTGLHGWILARNAYNNCYILPGICIYIFRDRCHSIGCQISGRKIDANRLKQLIGTDRILSPQHNQTAFPSGNATQSWHVYRKRKIIKELTRNSPVKSYWKWQKVFNTLNGSRSSSTDGGILKQEPFVAPLEDN